MPFKLSENTTCMMWLPLDLARHLEAQITDCCLKLSAMILLTVLSYHNLQGTFRGCEMLLLLSCRQSMHGSFSSCWLCEIWQGGLTASPFIQVMQHSQNASDFLSQGTFDFADTISSLLAMPRFGSVIRYVPRPTVMPCLALPCLALPCPARPCPALPSSLGRSQSVQICHCISRLLFSPDSFGN